MKISDFDFRIVKPKSKQWHCNNAECACNTPFIYDKEAFSRLGEFYGTEAEIELWSGFTDSEGVRIYEGDILKDELGREWVVRFERGRFATHRNACHKSDMLEDWHPLCLFLNMVMVEVIGNIHENADLLEK